MDRPVISGFGRARARDVLRSLVASMPLKTHEFNALAWLAYGGRRVGENAYAIRQAPDECKPQLYRSDRAEARFENFLNHRDLNPNLQWKEFNRRAIGFFRMLVTLRREQALINFISRHGDPG